MKKIDLAHINVKPLIKKTNKYDSAMFCYKFSRALNKMLHIKNIPNELTLTESKTIYGRDLEAIPSSCYVTSFSYGDEAYVGSMIFTAELCQYFIQKLLGGTDKSTLPLRAKELSSVEKTTLASLHGAIQLCLREALTPFLLLKDCHVRASEPSLPENDSFFCEEFSLSEPSQGALYLLLKTHSFD